MTAMRKTAKKAAAKVKPIAAKAMKAHKGNARRKG
jgi:hypothetical protein